MQGMPAVLCSYILHAMNGCEAVVWRRLHRLTRLCPVQCMCQCLYLGCHRILQLWDQLDVCLQLPDPFLQTQATSRHLLLNRV